VHLPDRQQRVWSRLARKGDTVANRAAENAGLRGVSARRHVCGIGQIAARGVGYLQQLLAVVREYGRTVRQVEPMMSATVRISVCVTCASASCAPRSCACSRLPLRPYQAVGADWTSSNAGRSPRPPGWPRWPGTVARCEQAPRAGWARARPPACSTWGDWSRPGAIRSYAPSIAAWWRPGEIEQVPRD
jgi:hypothetical protein